jgi:hypothetical protein
MCSADGTVKSLKSNDWRATSTVAGESRSRELRGSVAGESGERNVLQAGAI